LEIPESCCVFDADGGAGVSEADLAALATLQGGFSKCVVSHHLVADLLVSILCRFIWTNWDLAASSVCKFDAALCCIVGNY
jgi:hypothetical protein